MIVTLKSCFLHPRFLSFFFTVVFSYCGLFINEWYFTLNLFLITNLSKTINYILRSIFKHYGKLIISLLMTFLIILCYSFLFLNFKENINKEEYGNDVCNNYYSCYFNAVNMGMRMGGGLSDFLFLNSKPSKE